MIEFCSKKRMIAAVVILISISIIIVIIENRLPVGHEHLDASAAGIIAAPDVEVDNATKLCSNAGGSTEIVGSCKTCSEFQMKTLPNCKKTSFVERVKCRTEKGLGPEFLRSCRKDGRTEERHFWTFEASMLVTAVTSYSVVYVRQRRLDRLLVEKVHRQIAAGV